MSTNLHRLMYTLSLISGTFDPFFSLCYDCLGNKQMAELIKKWYVTQHPTQDANGIAWRDTNKQVFCMACNHVNPAFEPEPGPYGNFQVVRVYDATKQNTPAGFLFFANEEQISDMWFPDRAIRDQYFEEDVRPDLTRFFNELRYREAQMAYELEDDVTRDEIESTGYMSLGELQESLGTALKCEPLAKDDPAIIDWGGKFYVVTDTQLTGSYFRLDLKPYAGNQSAKERDNGPQ